MIHSRITGIYALKEKCISDTDVLMIFLLLTVGK
jgi:hypothetical protein